MPQAALEWPSIPGVTYNGLITTRYFLDLGPMFGDGIISNFPPSLAGRPTYPIFVSKVDQDGNEVAGIRLPQVAAPVATTTGWALRRAGFGENDGCESDGQHIPFKTTQGGANRRRGSAPLARGALQESRRIREGRDEGRPETSRSRGSFLPADVQVFIDEAKASNVLKPISVGGAPGGVLPTSFVNNSGVSPAYFTVIGQNPLDLTDSRWHRVTATGQLVPMMSTDGTKDPINPSVTDADYNIPFPAAGAPPFPLPLVRAGRIYVSLGDKLITQVTIDGQ